MANKEKLKVFESDVPCSILHGKEKVEKKLKENELYTPKFRLFNMRPMIF